MTARRAVSPVVPMEESWAMAWMRCNKFSGTRPNRKTPRKPRENGDPQPL